jgi:hypothetical protein
MFAAYDELLHNIKLLCMTMYCVCTCYVKQTRMNPNRIGQHLEGSGPDSIRRIIPALYWTEVPAYKIIIINYCSEYELELSFELNRQIPWQKSTRIQFVGFRTGESTYSGLYHCVR